MKKILFLSIVFVLIPSILIAKEYSLEELYSLALKRSEAVKIAEEEVYISEREKDRAIAVLLPTISTFGEYTRYTKERKKYNFIIIPEYSTSWGLRLDQSFSLSGRELTALRIAKESIKKSHLDLDSVKEDYLLSVASAYYDVLKSKKELEIATANVQRLTRHRDAAKTRLKVGEITKTVLLRAEAELLGAQSELIRAENNLKLAKTILARIVDLNEEYDVKEREIEPKDNWLKELTNNCQLPTIECLKQTALSEKAEIKALEIKRRIARDEVKYTKGLYWPSLSIEGVYLRREEHPSSSFVIDENIYGGLRLNFPFFEGGLRRAEVRQARARLRQIEYELSDLKDSIKIEVENAYLDLLTLSGILEKLEAEKEYAEENYKSVSRQFEYGLADSIDVMDANTLLVTAERKLASARYDYQMAILKLRRATGTLLKTVNAQLSTAFKEEKGE
jgi:outer membrane protein